MARIAVIGEALVDFTPFEDEGRHTGYKLHPGGSPFNVAVALARLGEIAFFGGRLSTDYFGRLLKVHLQQNGVRLDLLLTGDEPSPLSFVSNAAPDVEYSFRWHGTADQLLKIEDFDLAAYRTMDAVHFGSVELAYEPVASSILDLVRMLRDEVIITFDPNLRPQIFREAPSWRTAIDRAFEVADIVKLSDADLAVYGGSETVEPLLQRRNPIAVIVTRGEHGSDLYRTKRAPLHCPAAKVAVVDTIGAGDSYTAGLLAALARRGPLTREYILELDDEWAEVMAYASLVAGLTCERRGADAPLRSDVELSSLGLPQSRTPKEEASLHASSDVRSTH